jgi:hypothetical protein
MKLMMPVLEVSSKQDWSIASRTVTENVPSVPDFQKYSYDLNQLEELGRKQAA